MKLMPFEKLFGREGSAVLQVPIPSKLKGRHRKPDLTEERRENLRKLASYLYALPFDYAAIQFDMRAYMATSLEHDEDTVQILDWECGTIACAAGHGPAAGVAVPEGVGHWGAYIEKCFTGHEENSHEVYGWLFDGDWYNVDNTPIGAAKRIVYMLEYGVPLKPNGFPRKDVNWGASL